ncbi:hypothetical protein CMV_001381 [Castanea mollissima]|uniref:Uncharacterized protein n=1 Tax=Castanea mollissima TaxID=60419 RepID=A0A8J4RRN1_9ROSI|nr:hypothetical protein CMV_001381 [Castanea mollissima]
MAVVDNRDLSDDIAMPSAHAHTLSEMADKSLEVDIRNISKANLKRLDPKLWSKEARSDMESWSSDGYLEEPLGSLSNAQPPERSTESMDMQCEKGGVVGLRTSGIIRSLFN